MKHKLFFILISFIISANMIFPQQENGSEQKKLPEVKLAGTQLRTIHSSITGHDYDLYINLPRDYGDTTKTFPVVYCLDAQWDFALVESIFGQQYYDGFLPSLVVVGITWGGEHPNYDSLRAVDFTPGPKNSVQYGNAANFLKAIKEEIIPFIQSNYRVKKDNRTLIGSSFGGLFTLYAMFTEPGLFNKYIPTSPALTWDNGIIYKIEKDYAEKNKNLPVRLFMAIGGYEDLKPFQKFATIIRDANFKGLAFQTKVIEGVGHSGEKSEGFTRGMQFVFQRPDINVDTAVLNQYAGEYEFAPGSKLNLTVENGKLVAHVPGNNIILHAQSDKDFYIIGSYGFAHFKKDDSGKVTGFEFEQFTGKRFIKKISD